MFGVITLITPKGGTGKSTLARSLAAHWALTGHKPALVDADPQQTLAARYNPEGPMAGVPIVAEPEERVAEVIDDLRTRHAPASSTRRAFAIAPPSLRWSQLISPSSRSNRPSRTSRRLWRLSG